MESKDQIIELLATCLHFIPANEPALYADVEAACHQLRTNALAAAPAPSSLVGEQSVLESDAPTTELLGQLMRSVLKGRGFEFKGDNYELVDSENSRATSARYEVMDLYGDIVRYLRAAAATPPQPVKQTSHE